MLITAPDHVMFRELGGEAVLLDLKRQQYFGLNEVGTRVWLQIQSGADLEAIVAAIVNEYDAGPEQARSDIERLIGELRSAQLIEVQDDPEK